MAFSTRKREAELSAIPGERVSLSVRALLPYDILAYQILALKGFLLPSALRLGDFPAPALGEGGRLKKGRAFIAADFCLLAA